MKIIPALLFAACIHTHANSVAQGITLSLARAPMEKAFAEIQKQVGANFLYTEALLKKAKPLTIKIRNATLGNALDHCFASQPLTYRIVNHTVVVMEKPVAVSAAKADTFPVITGIVKSNSMPLEGVSVMLKNANIGALTNELGEFRLFNIPSRSTLQFSAVGYEDEEAKIISSLPIEIHLTPFINELDQAVVIGYGKTTKRINTGSVSKISQTEIAAQPVSNPLAALAGRMSGVYISQKTGVPGGNFTIQIRGRNSIRDEGNFPLYVVDGVPFTSTTLSSVYASGTITQMGNPLNLINPADIESIEILKDADATAIYGSRGSNGVVLITTKKGKAGKTSLDINYYEGAGWITHEIPLLNTEQYIEMRTEAFANDGAMPGASDYDINGRWPLNKFTDWQKALIGNTANMRNLQAALQGGNKQTNFLLRGAYNRETTVFPGNSGNQKLTAHLQFSHLSLNEKFKLTVNSTLGNEQNDLPQFDLLYFANTIAPNAPELYSSDGKLNWEDDTWDNPFAELAKEYKSNTNNLINNVVASYLLMPSLELKASIGYSLMTLKETSVSPSYSFRPMYGVTSGFSIFNDGSINTFIVEPQLNYHHTLAGGNLQVLLGSTFQRTRRQSESLLGSEYSNDNQLLNKQAAADISVMEFEKTDYKYAGVFTRLHYNIKDRYIVNLTARRDGSSRFAPGKQYGIFGSIGAGWVFSLAPAVRELLPWLSFGKLRMSYGSSGNDQIGDYQYLNTFIPASYSYEGVRGLQPARLSNPDFKWEVNYKWEAAIEMGLWNNKVFFSMAHFRNRSTNQLVGYFLPPTTGFNSVNSNLPATVQNTGFEIEANASVIKTKRFHWSTGINVTIPRNKLISFPNIQGSSYANLYEVGASLDTKKAFHYIGIDPFSGVYQFMDVDANGSGLDYPQDLSASAEISQKLFGGWQTTVRQGNFSVDIFVQFVKQQGISYLTSFEVPGSFSNQPAEVLNRWQKPGDLSTVQRFTTNVHPDASIAYSFAKSNSDLPVSDASFARIKNISISYMIEDSWIKKADMSLCRLYIQSQNLFTFTNYIGYDPENNGASRLPPLKTIVAGIQITF